MQSRKESYYDELRDLVIVRDRMCRRAYMRILGVPKSNVFHVHHVMPRNGCPSMDREDNLIALAWEDHETKAHGPEAAKWRILYREYLHCEEVETWREKHSAEIAAAAAKKEECRIRRKRKDCTVKKTCNCFR